MPDRVGTLEIYRRSDGKYAWRLTASNGRIIATDGGQGYDHPSDAEAVALHLVDGGYAKSTLIVAK